MRGLPVKIVRFIAGMHFFVLIPVIGLAIAACNLGTDYRNDRNIS
jgi:hypothetical protein